MRQPGMVWGRRKTTENMVPAGEPGRPKSASDSAQKVAKVVVNPPESEAKRTGSPSRTPLPSGGSEAWSIIGKDMTIDGSLTTGSPLRVVGAVEGSVTSARDVEVEADAMVQGGVTGQNVTVAGLVDGQVSAAGRLVILASGKVNGDVSVRSILIEEGGVLSGRCQMQ